MAPESDGGLRYDPELRQIVWQSDVQQHIKMHNAFTPQYEGIAYFADGTESGASLREEHGRVVIDVSGGNAQIQARCQVGETGGDSGGTNIVYSYEYMLNTGSWTSVTTTSSVVRIDTGSSLTFEGATTDRMSGGTGTFVAGEQLGGSGSGNSVTVSAPTAGNHTQIVAGLLIIAADVSHGDTIAIRIIADGASMAVTSGIYAGLSDNIRMQIDKDGSVMRFVPQSSAGAIAGAVSSVTLSSRNIPADADVMLAFIATRDSAGGVNGTSVTVNGTSMTEIQDTVIGNLNLSVYILNNPSSAGSGDIVFTFGSAVDGGHVGHMFHVNTDATTPVRASAVATGTDNSPTVDVSSSTNDVAWSLCNLDANLAMTAGADETADTSTSAQNYNSTGASTHATFEDPPSGSTATLSRGNVTGSPDWVIVAVSFQPTATASNVDMDASVAQSLSMNSRLNALRPLDGTVPQALSVLSRLNSLRSLTADVAQALTFSPQIDVNEIIELDNTSTTGAGTGNLSWTHSPNGFLRAIVVAVVYNDNTDPNQVTAVTYGGQGLTRMNGSPFSSIAGTEAGTVDCWWLVGAAIGDLPAGDQTIVVTVSSGAIKKAFGVGIRSTRGLTVIDLNKKLDGTVVANPSSTLPLHGKLCLVFEAFMSGHADVANTTPPAGWTSDAEEVLSAELAGLYTYDTKDTADVTIGWTQTSDDALALAYALGPDTGMIDMDGAIAMALTHSSQFGLQKDLNASIASSLALAGRLGALRPLDANIPQTLSVSSHLTRLRNIDAQISMGILASSQLNVVRPFEALVSSALTVSSAAQMFRGMYGSINTALTTSAWLNAPVNFDSLIASSLSLNADMSRLRSLESNIASALTVSSQLDVVPAGATFVDLDSSVGSSLSFAGNLGTLIGIDASLGMTSSVSASMGPARGLSSQVPFSSQLDGALGKFIPFDSAITSALTLNADISRVRDFAVQIATALVVAGQLDVTAPSVQELASQIALSMAMNAQLDPGPGFSAIIQSSLLTQADLNVVRDFDAQFAFSSSVNARLNAVVNINGLVNSSLAINAQIGAYIGLDGDIQCSLLISGEAQRLIGLSAQVDFVCTSQADASCIVGMWGTIEQALSVIAEIDGVSDIVFEIGSASVKIIERGSNSSAGICSIGGGATVRIKP